MRRPPFHASFAAAALAIVGCADLLGVEDVEQDGAGGGASGTGGASPEGSGAGLPVTGSSTGAEATTVTATTTSGDATATATTGDGSSSSATTSSSGGGSSCGTVLPSCAAAVPSAFGSDAELDLGFDRDGDSDEVDSAGGMLELEPRDDDDPRYAAVKSKVAIAAPESGACAVWVTLVETGSEIEASIAIGPGTPSEDAYRLERRGPVIAAQVEGVDVAQVPYVKDVTRIFRIWLDSAGQVGFDVSTDGVCWTAVGNPMLRTATEGLVRLHAEGEAGKAKLDDFCL